MKMSEKLKGKERAKERATQKKKYWVALGVVAAVVVVGVVLFFVLFSSSGAKPGDTVSVYYTGMLDNGTVFDSNMNGTPLSFTLGKGALITGFENAVKGMSAGQEKTVWIPVEKAYGPYRSDLVHAVSRGEFPANETPAVGQIYTARRTGSTAVNWFTVTKFNDTYVTIDENHMLSGQNLTFVIRVVSVNKGTA